MLHRSAGSDKNVLVHRLHARRFLGAPPSLSARECARDTPPSLHGLPVGSYTAFLLSLLFATIGVRTAHAGCLNWWPFSDTNWLSASGSGPMACTNLACVTNLAGVPMGNGRALELNTNDPAFLRYFATE